MQKGPHLLDNCKPGKMMLRFNSDSFVFSLMQVIFIALVVSNVFADGIVLRGGLQMVVTIRDTSGDSISIQEGMWEAEIAKSLIASFWYNGKQYSYVKNNSGKPYSPSTVSQPNNKPNQPDITIANNHDSCATIQTSEDNIGNSQKEDLLLTSDTLSIPESLQRRKTTGITSSKVTIPQIDSNTVINHIPEITATISSDEDLVPLADTALLKDLDLNDNDTAPDKSAELEPLFDPEYTNEELVKKKHVFNILLTTGYALGATSTTAFIVSNDWEVQFFAVPFMIASIPLTTVGTIKSIEYRRRL